MFVRNKINRSQIKQFVEKYIRNAAGTVTVNINIDDNTIILNIFYIIPTVKVIRVYSLGVQ